MANGISHLPHIKNIQAGMNKHDPIHSSMFEVYFTLPDAIRGEFSEDEVILTEQVTQVDGLDVLQKTSGAGQQKFMGVDVSFLNPVLDQTFAEPGMQLNLNLRNGNDAYVLKVFKAWARLGYDMSDGTRTLKKDYASATVRIAEANRDGTIWRSYIFHDVMLTECTGLNDLNYTQNDARILSVKFRSDYWDDDLA